MAEDFKIETSRLTLRPPVLADATQIAERIGVREVVWNLGRAPYPYAISDAEDWIARTTVQCIESSAHVMVIELAGAGVIGCAGLDLVSDQIWELGYWVGQPWWGRGYVTEASGALLNWARAEQGIEAFVSGHFIDNPASGRVLEKLGFRAVGETELFGKARGAACPAVRYVLNAPETAALRTSSH